MLFTTMYQLHRVNFDCKFLIYDSKNALSFITAWLLWINQNRQRIWSLIINSFTLLIFIWRSWWGGWPWRYWWYWIWTCPTFWCQDWSQIPTEILQTKFESWQTTCPKETKWKNAGSLQVSFCQWYQNSYLSCFSDFCLTHIAHWIQ